ncbi:hypothetical protein ACVIIV_004155 [Bradyrhizobium sp. USDA 4354]
MVDWRQGGWTGSINRWVRREIRNHTRENPAALRVRYGLAVRVLRRYFRLGTFWKFFALYFLLDLLAGSIEVLAAWAAPEWLPTWTTSGPPGPDIKALVLNVSSYLISTQVGLLGVVSLALALVTLVSQREGAESDVKLYYHESLSFEIVASCMALLAVLCLQLLWPLQFLLHRLSLGTELQVFKLGLLGLHLTWLLVNLGAVSYFILTTFRFVQQSAREQLRERYTANVVLPREMAIRLRQQLYSLGGQKLMGIRSAEKNEEDEGPSVIFGFDFGEPDAIEIEATFLHPMALHDVRMVWVRWVARRWVNRSIAANKGVLENNVAGLKRAPILWFTPHIDHPMHGKCGWCRRRGGARLTRLEKAVLQRAFRFRRSSDDA